MDHNAFILGAMLHYGQLQCYSYGILRIILPSVHCTLNNSKSPDPFVTSLNKFMSNQGMDPAHSYFLRHIRIQTLPLCNGWRSDVKYVQDAVTYCFGRLCAAIPNVVIRHNLLDCNWLHKAGELMQNPKENKSVEGEEPLWVIAAESAARRDVQVGIHEDVCTYGNERKHQKSSLWELLQSGRR